MQVNDACKKAMADRIIKAMGGDVKGKTIGILGLAFKPNTDDMRDAPSLDIIPALQAAGARVKAYDPESMHEAGKMLTGVDFCDGPYHAVDGADAASLLVFSCCGHAHAPFFQPRPYRPRDSRSCQPPQPPPDASYFGRNGRAVTFPWSRALIRPPSASPAAPPR